MGFVAGEDWVKPETTPGLIHHPPQIHNVSIHLQGNQGLCSKNEALLLYAGVLASFGGH